MRAAEPRTVSPTQGDGAELPLVRVTILPDEMTAVTTVEAGVLVSEANLEASLQRAGVFHGHLRDAIRALAVGQGRREAVVARGEYPQDGQDAWFQPLIEMRRDIGAPKLQPDGRVDYLDLGYAQAVRIGDPLMRRFAASKGQPGRNVLGEELVGRDGKDRTFRRVGRGTRISPEDPDLLIATVSGLPVFGPDFVQVDPVLRLPAVDVSTGHITFAGTVIVVGDVANGLRIEADRDVIVAGTVEGAEIIAGGTVELRGGMVGQGRGRIQAGGSVTARYLDGVAVSAGEDLYFEETLSHCHVSVARDVVSLSALGRGQIIGGQVRAGRAIRVRTLGAPAGTATNVHVGADPAGEERKRRTFARLEQLQQELDVVSRKLVQQRLAGVTGTALAAFVAKREGLVQECAAAQEDWERANAGTGTPGVAFISAADYFYAGVEVGIGELRRSLHDDVPGASLIAKGGHIVARA